MFKKTLIIACLGISSCYAMEGELDNKLVLVPVTEQKDLIEGIQFCEEGFDKGYEAVPEPERGTIMNYLKEFRPTVEATLKQRLAHGILTAAYVRQGKTNVAFVAAHQDEKNSSWVYLDKAVLVPNNELRAIAPLLMGYLLQKYPNTDKLLTYALKANERYNTPVYQSLLAQGFLEASHEDKLHPTEWFQNWEKQIRE